MKISIICNTCNRGEHLKRLLIALSKQTYDDFEVVVVNGPSTDCTKDVIEKYREAIKIADCPVVRLGVSRNIGIQNAAGDILVFIDDDAIPGDRHWLEKLIAYYKDPLIGGVGGAVYNLQGGRQFENGYIDVWGTPYVLQDISQDFNDPNGERFNYIMGCNCSFRRSAIEKVRGYDEYYDYGHDEADLSVRIIKAGYKILHHPYAFVFHERATGPNRKDNYHLDWYKVAKSLMYFGIKNSESFMPNIDKRIEHMLRKTNEKLAEFSSNAQHGYITEKEAKEFQKLWKNGLEKGLSDATNMHRILLNIDKSVHKFKKFRKNIFHDTLNIVLLCENFNIQAPSNGIASYTAQLAKDFNALGHCVHIIVPGKYSDFSLIDGVNIHTVAIKEKQLLSLKQNKELQYLISISYTCMKKIQQLKTVFAIDIIESPLWNALGVVSTAVLKSPPLCVRLETPLKMIEKIHHMEKTRSTQLIEDMESYIMQKADGIIYISDSIRKTVENMYQIEIKQPSIRNYLGIKIADSLPKINKTDKKLIVFFIGRLERRKGIHNLLSAISQVISKHKNVEFHIAGDDKIVDKIIGKSFKEDFLSKANREELDNVKFLGEINADTKELELQKCDIFVAPSLYESFGIIFLEAMRYGKPVIGCQAGGMPEIIEDGVSGLLAQPDDVKSLVNCLEKLIESTSLREKLGKSALQRTMEKFNNMKQAEESISFYRKIIDFNRCQITYTAENVDDVIQEAFVSELGHSPVCLETGLDKHFIEKTKVYFEGEDINPRYLFPWQWISAGSNIIIYGAGVVGKTYLKQIEYIPYCNILAVCDKKWNQIDKMKVPIISLDDFLAMDKDSYDVVLIAIAKEIIARSIRENLMSNGIPSDKIIWADPIRKV